jgi:hypothetical protein
MLTACALATLSWATIGCSGSKPVATPSVTPTAVETPTATPTVEVSASPTETAAQKEYERKRADVEGLVLGRGFEKAIPLLRDLEKEQPEDPLVQFYLMLSLGSLEDEPGPKTEAFTVANILIEKPDVDPNLKMRAQDYVNCALSEPKKPLPDINVPAIEGGGELKFAKDSAYDLSKPVTLLETDTNTLTADIKKDLWFMEVRPEAITTKLALPKGTKVAVRDARAYFISKKCWKTTTREDADQVDTNTFDIMAVFLVVVDGPLKGKQGWYVNQMDRFRGMDEDKKRVWGVKIAPRIVFEAPTK